MAELNFTKLCENVANELLNNYEINGKSFREWLDILVEYVADQEEAPKEANLFIYDAEKKVFKPLKYTAPDMVKTKAPEETPQRLTVREWRNLDPWETCGQDAHCNHTPFDAGGCRRGCIVPKIYAKLARFEDEQEGAKE